MSKFPSHKVTSTTLSSLGYICKDPLFKSGHIHRCLGLKLQHGEQNVKAKVPLKTSRSRGGNPRQKGQPGRQRGGQITQRTTCSWGGQERGRPADSPPHRAGSELGGWVTTENFGCHTGHSCALSTFYGKDAGAALGPSLSARKSRAHSMQQGPRPRTNTPSWNKSPAGKSRWRPQGLVLGDPQSSGSPRRLPTFAAKGQAVNSPGCASPNGLCCGRSA